MAKRAAKKAATSKKVTGRSKARGGAKVYTLEVFLISGPVTEKFVKKNPVISRTIQIRGDQTLEDLHYAIFDAFGRWEEHMYEFQFGKRPMEPDAPRYVMASAYKVQVGEGEKPAGRTDEATMDSLGLRKGRAFGYWFDFGDDWWHQINVEGIEEGGGKGKYPKVIKKEGASPPQYAEEL